jgi:hypothetical protein
MIDVIGGLASRAPSGDPGEEAALTSLAVSPDGRWVAAGFRNFLPRVALFSAESGAAGHLLALGLDDEFEGLGPDEEREARVELLEEHDKVFFDFFHTADMAFSADASLLAVLSMNHDNGNQLATRLEVFRVDSGERILRIEGDAQRDGGQVFGPASFGWHPRCNEIVVALFNGAVERWDVVSGRKLRDVRPRGDSEHFVQVAAVGIDASGEAVAWLEGRTLELRVGQEAARHAVAIPEGTSVRQGRILVEPEVGPVVAVICEELGGFCARPSRGVHVAEPDARWIAAVSSDGSLTWGADTRGRLEWQNGAWVRREDTGWHADDVVTAAMGGGCFAWTDGRSLSLARA